MRYEASSIQGNGSIGVMLSMGHQREQLGKCHLRYGKSSIGAAQWEWGVANGGSSEGVRYGKSSMGEVWKMSGIGSDQ